MSGILVFSKMFILHLEPLHEEFVLLQKRRFIYIHFPSLPFSAFFALLYFLLFFLFFLESMGSYFIHHSFHIEFQKILKIILFLSIFRGGLSRHEFFRLFILDLLIELAGIIFPDNRLQRTAFIVFLY